MKIFLIVMLILTPIPAVHSQIVDSIKTDAAVQDTALADSAKAAADSLKLAKVKPIIPLFPQGMLSVHENVQVISRREIIYNTYNYTGDLIELFPLGFQRNLGIMGQPHEVLIYGNGFNGVTYLMDGLLLNNRYTNSLDLNYVQSEAIDSIEVIPSPRAFLYGTFNNPSAVNFIPRENYSIDSHQGPFSRIRFYQAPNEESMIDATYRTYLARRLVGIFEMTNYSTTDRFPNSSHGSWKFRSELNYLLSDNYNMKAAYKYNRTETRLFGGVNIDSLNARDTLGVPELSEPTTPVNNPTRYQKYHEHQFNLTLRNAVPGPLSGKVDIYYISSLAEQRENERDSLFSLSLDNRYKVYGALIDQRVSADFYDLQFYSTAEHIIFRPYRYNNKETMNTYAAAGKAAFRFLNDRIVPSFFAKYLNYNKNTYYGIGADVYFRLNNVLSFYAGLSRFSTLSGFPDKRNINTYEIGAVFKAASVNISLNGFNQSAGNFSIPLMLTDMPHGYAEDNSTSGIGLDLFYNIWKIHLETHSAYYYSRVSGTDWNLLPDFTVQGKLFYQDTLFSANLFLKTGIQAKYIGAERTMNYDFFTMRTFYYNDPVLNDPVYNIDFFLIGEIRRRAIIYFTFENLLDKKQYIVPGYPLPSRGLRLGVSWEFLN